MHTDMTYFNQDVFAYFAATAALDDARELRDETDRLLHQELRKPVRKTGDIGIAGTFYDGASTDVALLNFRDGIEGYLNALESWSVLIDPRSTVGFDFSAPLRRPGG